MLSGDLADAQQRTRRFNPRPDHDLGSLPWRRAMREEVTQSQLEAAMMAVIAEIADGGQGLIRDWPLVANAEQALREGGPDGLARYYQDCIDRPGSRAAWIKATLQAHGKKTLESEYQRFMMIYREDLEQ
jgi:hypothetical protein